MVVRVSESLAHTYRFPNYPHLHVLVRLYKARLAYRRQMVRLFGRERERCPVPAALTPSLEAQANHFAANGWAYAENVFTPEFHRRLVDEWPASYYFHPMYMITKSFELGFQWAGRKDVEAPHLAQNPVVRELYDFLRSDGFAAQVTRLCGDGIPRACYSIALTRSHSGTSVIPHQDSVVRQPQGHTFLNLVFFINGTGGKRAGGLNILKDPEYKEVVFEPTNLRNAVMTYKSAAPLFHGFPPMRMGTFRWTVNTQFCSREWLEHIKKNPSAMRGTDED